MDISKNDRAMPGVEVYVAKNELISILSDDGGLVQIHPSQVETVIKWLREAKNG